MHNSNGGLMLFGTADVHTGREVFHWFLNSQMVQSYWERGFCVVTAVIRLGGVKRRVCPTQVFCLSVSVEHKIPPCQGTEILTPLAALAVLACAILLGIVLLSAHPWHPSARDEGACCHVTSVLPGPAGAQSTRRGSEATFWTFLCPADLFLRSDRDTKVCPNKKDQLLVLVLFVHNYVNSCLVMLHHVLVVASVALSAVHAANFGYWGYNK
jgi:hypothetical protein